MRAIIAAAAAALILGGCSATESSGGSSGTTVDVAATSTEPPGATGVPTSSALRPPASAALPSSSVAPPAPASAVNADRAQACRDALKWIDFAKTADPAVTSSDAVDKLIAYLEAASPQWRSASAKERDETVAGARDAIDGVC